MSQPPVKRTRAAVDTLDPYQKRLRREAAGEAGAAPRLPEWVEVKAAPAAGGAGLRVVCGNRLRVEVERGRDAATLVRLLDVLGRG